MRGRKKLNMIFFKKIESFQEDKKTRAPSHMSRRGKKIITHIFKKDPNMKTKKNQEREKKLPASPQNNKTNPNSPQKL